MQLARRLAWLGLALLDDRDGAEDEAEALQVEMHAEVVPQASSAGTAAPQPQVALLLDTAPADPSGEQGAERAEVHLRSASRAYAANKLRASVENLTGADAPKPNRPSRRPPLASA